MRIEDIKNVRKQLHKIASRHGIQKIYVFGSVARGESNEASDVDFLIEMDANASALGVGAFQYEVQQLLGTDIDVIPTFALKKIKDKAFARKVQSEAVAI